jgi:hypothetical protein
VKDKWELDMKLTEAYIDIIINWWTQFLVNDKYSNLTAANIDDFKHHLNSTLSAVEFESGEKLKIRVGLREFTPNDNSLAKAFSESAKLVGLSPTHFPHGAELEINEVYQIITCCNVGEVPKNFPLTNILPAVKSKSLDAVSYVTKSVKDVLNVVSSIEIMLASKKRKLHDSEKLSPIGSPISSPSIPYISQRQPATYFASSTSEANFLKQSGFFKHPLNAYFDQPEDSDAVKHQKIETDRKSLFCNSI